MFILKFRVRAYNIWLGMLSPKWARLNHSRIDYQSIVYYSAPKIGKKLDSLLHVDDEILKTFEKLGIPLAEQKRLANVAVDAIFDSVSVITTFKDELAQIGVIISLFSREVFRYSYTSRR
jgi:Fe-S cluster assembly protein SufB